MINSLFLQIDQGAFQGRALELIRNDTKMETTAKTLETVAELLNALEASINTSYNRQLSASP